MVLEQLLPRRPTRVAIRIAERSQAQNPGVWGQVAEFARKVGWGGAPSSTPRCWITRRERCGSKRHCDGPRRCESCSRRRRRGRRRRSSCDCRVGPWCCPGQAVGLEAPTSRLRQSTSRHMKASVLSQFHCQWVDGAVDNRHVGRDYARLPGGGRPAVGGVACQAVVRGRRCLTARSTAGPLLGASSRPLRRHCFRETRRRSMKQVSGAGLGSPGQSLRGQVARLAPCPSVNRQSSAWWLRRPASTQCPGRIHRRARRPFLRRVLGATGCRAGAVSVPRPARTSPDPYSAGRAVQLPWSAGIPCQTQPKESGQVSAGRQLERRLSHPRTGAAARHAAPRSRRADELAIVKPDAVVRQHQSADHCCPRQQWLR